MPCRHCRCAAVGRECYASELKHIQNAVFELQWLHRSSPSLMTPALAYVAIQVSKVGLGLGVVVPITDNPRLGL